MTPEQEAWEQRQKLADVYERALGERMFAKARLAEQEKIQAAMAPLEAEIARLRKGLLHFPKKWKSNASDARKEAGLIRKTIKAYTDAEERCLVRADIWEICAGELDSVLGDCRRAAEVLGEKHEQ